MAPVLKTQDSSIPFFLIYAGYLHFTFFCLFSRPHQKILITLFVTVDRFPIRNFTDESKTNQSRNKNKMAKPCISELLQKRLFSAIMPTPAV